MTRTSPLLLLALTAVAPGCGHEAAPSFGSDVKAVASAVASVASGVKDAVEHPVNPYVPGTTPLPRHEAISVHVPHEGNTSGAALKARHPPGGSPAPRVARQKVELPKMHTADGKPWECLDNDECYFPRMPFYSQTNPNLAHIKLPKASYDADTSKLTGPIVWDDATKGYALVLDPDGARTKDPYYNTWLPYGPVSDKDEGYLGVWLSALCGPTAEAMAVMAAFAARGAGTRAKKGSWVETSFLDARPPEGQAPLPSPLLRDHTTLAPDQRQMTEKEIQRLVNMAVKEGTSPVGGGGDGVMTSIGDQFELVGGKSPVETRQDQGKPMTNQVLMKDLRDGFAPVIAIAEFKASLKPVNEGGKLVKYTLTFSNTGGHFLAVNGFTTKGKKRGSLLIYDPVYANPVRKSIAPLAIAGATKDGVPIEITAPFGDHLKALPVLNDLGPGAPKALDGAEDFTDGQDVTLVGGYSSIKID